MNTNEQAVELVRKERDAARILPDLLDLLEQAVCPNRCIEGMVYATHHEFCNHPNDPKVPCQWCARVKEILEGE